MKLRLIPWFSLATAGVLAVSMATGTFSMRALAQDADEPAAEEPKDEGDDGDDGDDEAKDKDKERAERPRIERGPEEFQRRMEERMKAFKDLRDQIQETQQEMAKLRRDGEDTSEAEGRLKELHDKMTKLQREFGGGPGGLSAPGGPDDGFRSDLQREEMTSRMKARLEELEAAIAKAEESDDKEELRRLRREANQTKHRLEAMTGQGPGRSNAYGGIGVPNEEAQKLMHLRMAAQHLKLAGLEDQADAIAKQADELAEKLGDEGDFVGGFPGGPGAGGFAAPPLGNFPGAGPGPGGPGFGPPGGDPAGAVREEVNQLRKEIEALRRELRKAVGNDDRGNDDDGNEDRKSN